MSVNIYNATNNELKPIASDSIDASTLADKTDISSIVTSGTTNSTGSTITSGTWFYLNGDLCKAKADIANGATFTLNTNYEKKTVGDTLKELNTGLTIDLPIQIVTGTSWENSCSKLRNYNARILVPRIMAYLETANLTNGIHTGVSGNSVIDPSTVVVSNYSSYQNYTIFYQDGNIWICNVLNHKVIVVGR